MAGLDQEQPDQQYFSALGTAIQNGQVPQSRLDNMVHRILRAMFQVGLFDNPQTIQPIPAAADAAIAQQVEENGAVLLKNNNGALPLSAARAVDRCDRLPCGCGCALGRRIGAGAACRRSCADQRLPLPAVLVGSGVGSIVAHEGD